LRSDRVFEKAWIRRELDKAMWLLWLSDNVKDDTICCIALQVLLAKSVFRIIESPAGAEKIKQRDGGIDEKTLATHNTYSRTNNG
jgi:hypothetical protein